MTLVSRLRPLLGLLRGRRHLLAGAVVVGVVNQLLTIAIAVIGAYLVGRAGTGARADELMPLLWIMVALIVPRAFTPWLESLLSHILAYRVLGRDPRLRAPRLRPARPRLPASAALR